MLKYHRILEKIYTFLKVQQGMGKLRQLWKQSDTSAKLETCKTDLEQSLNTFRVKSHHLLLFIPLTIHRLVQGFQPQIRSHN
jgi:hypothetical protein